MKQYMIMTDSSCDMTNEMAVQLGVEAVPLSVTIGEDTYKNYLDEREIKLADYYRRLRGGEMAKTSAVNTEAFVEAFTPVLERGVDVLYLGFSSGLSATCQCAQVAAKEVNEKFKDNQVHVVDTLCASMGQGLIVYLAVQKQREGASLEEVRDYVEGIKLNIAHWFTVDDLHFLKRGGRISAATEIVGSMLSIKPVMHVDNEGRLIKMEAVRGRKASIRRLKEKAVETHRDADSLVFISHGDCLEEAQSLARMIEEEMSVAQTQISFIGPVVSAHSGPGTIALFFVAKER